MVERDTGRRRSGEEPEPFEIARAYNRYRRALRRVVFWSSLACAVVIVAGLLFGIFGAESGEGYFETEEFGWLWWLWLAMLVVVAAETALLLKRPTCPFCRQKVHPRLYPRPGVRCPNCDGTVEGE